MLTLLSLEQESVLNDIRSYVRGESLYTKGQNDALRHLTRYIEKQKEEDFKKFLEGISIPLGDKTAREALLQKQPDYTLAYKGFLEGGNHPDDIDGMIFFLTYFHSLPYVRESIQHWSDADAINSKILELGYKIQKDIQNKTTKNLDSYKEELNTLAQKGKESQSAFSSVLSEGA